MNKSVKKLKIKSIKKSALKDMKKNKISSLPEYKSIYNAYKVMDRHEADVVSDNPANRSNATNAFQHAALNLIGNRYPKLVNHLNKQKRLRFDLHDSPLNPLTPETHLFGFYDPEKHKIELSGHPDNPLNNHPAAYVNILAHEMYHAIDRNRYPMNEAGYRQFLLRKAKEHDIVDHTIMSNLLQMPVNSTIRIVNKLGEAKLHHLVYKRLPDEKKANKFASTMTHSISNALEGVNGINERHFKELSYMAKIRKRPIAKHIATIKMRKK